MKKLLLLLLLIPSVVMAEAYTFKSCKTLPTGTEVILNPLGYNEYESHAIREGLRDKLVEVFITDFDGQFGCSGNGCPRHYDIKVELNSFSYDLNGDGVDEVFTIISNPRIHGQDGSPVYLIQKINGKWTIGPTSHDGKKYGYLYYLIKMGGYGERAVIANEKINGYKVIYTRSRLYLYNSSEALKPKYPKWPGAAYEECPYDVKKCIYSKVSKSYECMDSELWASK